MFEISLYYLILINIIGFLQMGWDKRQAIKGAWRIKENILLLTAVLGGAIGSYLGMQTFRHKTQKIKFKYGLPLLVMGNLFLIGFIV